MSGSSDDPFHIGPFSSRSTKEQITPHKLSLLVLLHEYQVMRGFIPATDMDDSTSCRGVALVNFTEREKRHFMTTMLDLLQCPDLKIKDLKARLQPLLHPQLMSSFLYRLEQFKLEGSMAVMDFIDTLGSYVYSNHNDMLIHRSSVAGIFVRRLWLSFSRLSFSQVCDFHARLCTYIQEGEQMEVSSACLTDSFMNFCTSQSMPRGLHLEDISNDSDDTCQNRAYFSQKQAEFFIAQQAQLLSHDENKALSPNKLQEQVTAILQANPDLAEAHFLSYLNSLRVKEYCSALHSLYHYFDRNARLMGEVTPSKKWEEEVSRRYAALNLAALHSQFDHKVEARAALLEAIRMAQEANDHVCLQHALAWLNLLSDQGTQKTASQMERSIAKSGELSLPVNVTITLCMCICACLYACVCVHANCSVLEYMMKSNVINCQHSLYAMMAVSGAQRAALWSYYGNRECASMCAQTVLCLNTSESGVFYNGEPICMALCHLARHHADKGAYSCAMEILQHARQRFPPHTKHAYLWQMCQQYIMFERALLAGRWAEAERAAGNVRALNDAEGRLLQAILHREQGEVNTSLSLLHTLVDLSSSSNDFLPDLKCRILLALAEVYLLTGNHTAALPHLANCLTHANTHHLVYLAAMSTMHLAVIQLRMKLPSQALNLLETVMLTVLSHGSSYDRARLLFIYVRCKVASASLSHFTQRTFGELMLDACCLMTTVVRLFESIEATSRVKDAVYYLARLYHQLGNTAERNRCAHRFKQLDQQVPTLAAVRFLGNRVPSKFR
ncbi:hypothetical protein C0Q70_18170 [Pomacea canaliculata]|uniref:Anaphase-promoting complex subunit 5 n=1 Tax=Pomacea canaliculata TaxID=400727 RepID=A0A2T7NMF8_POMCA|nr:hypothetical protein C0Q70_18170 [Pomacea canaliculata]